jgi:hypothetical protein
VERLKGRQSLVIAVLAVAGIPSAHAAGGAMHWGAGVVRVDLALEDGRPAQPATADVEEAAALAVGTYVAALGDMTPDLQLDVGRIHGRSPAASPSDRVNTVRWQEGAWADDYDRDALAITHTTYDPATGRILDSDIIMNSEKAWTTGADGCDDRYDVQAVLTHELGHLLGLSHDTSDPDSAMYPSAGVCEQKKRHLSSGDLANLVRLYSDLEPAADGAPAGVGCAVGHGPGGGAPFAAIVLLMLMGWRARAYGTATERRRPG